MSNVSDTNSIEILNNISTQLNRYFSIFILLFGTIGNFLNCFVLSQPSLRSNPCAFLFLISSIANSISITFGLSTRIMSGWYMDITNTHTWICKVRVFITFVSRTIAFWLIALAAIDRWCLSCNQYQRRQKSSLKNAQLGTILIITLSMFVYLQVIYCYDANIVSAPLRCYGQSVRCRLLADITYAFITILGPILIMFIFGLITISNLRQTFFSIQCRTEIIEKLRENKTILPLTSRQRERRRRVDRYLRHVLFVQIILLSLFTLPQATEKLYTTLTMNRKKSLLHITIDNFIYNFVLLLSYVASGMPFYIYTLSGGNIFRNTLFDLLQPIIEKIRLE
jgi:hypothetical protein